MSFSFNNLIRNTVPAGTYEVVLEDIKFKTSTTGESSSNLMCVFRITKGTYTGKTIVHTIYEKAFSFRLGGFLKACGIDMNKEFSTTKELYEYGISEAKGKTLNIEVTIRQYNGNEYNDVSKFLPLSTSSTTAQDVAEMFKNIEETPNTLDVAFKAPAESPDFPSMPDTDVMIDIDINEDDKI